jgi:hypothetical protein
MFGIIGILIFLGLAVLAYKRPWRCFLIILSCYPFFIVGPDFMPIGIGEYSILTSRVLIIPVLLIIFIKSKPRFYELSKIDIFIASFGIIYIMSNIINQFGNFASYAFTLRTSIWFFAWIPVRFLMDDEKKQQEFIGALVISLLAIAILTVQEYFTSWNYLNWTTKKTFADIIYDRFGQTRIAGPFGHGVPNAIMLAILLPFCFVWKRKYIALVAGILGITAIIMNQGRSAWIGLLFATVISAPIIVRGGVLKSKHIFPIVIILLITIILFTGQIMWNINVISSTFSLIPDEYGASSLRIFEWKNAIDRITGVPFFGYGYNAMQGEYITYYSSASRGEWPLPLALIYTNGWLMGIAGIILLVFCSVFLYFICFKRLYVPISQRLAIFIAFTSAAVAMFSNWAGYYYVLPISFMCLSFIEQSNRVNLKLFGAIQ